jgi:hypothetical protein
MLALKAAVNINRCFRTASLKLLMRRLQWLHAAAANDILRNIFNSIRQNRKFC